MTFPWKGAEGASDPIRLQRTLFLSLQKNGGLSISSQSFARGNGETHMAAVFAARTPMEAQLPVCESPLGASVLLVYLRFKTLICSSI